ncbi:MAG: transcription-repair coupling factor [Thermodesulfobacteriota bacterium]
MNPRGSFAQHFSLLHSDSSRPWRQVGITGLKGSSAAYVLSCLQDGHRGSFLILCPRLRDAELFMGDLQFFYGKKIKDPLLFPPYETLPYEGLPPHPEILKERMRALLALLEKKSVTLVTTASAILQKVLSPPQLRESIFSLHRGEEVDRERLVSFLREGGFVETKIVEERGDFSLRGALIDFFPSQEESPFRLEFEGDRLVSIRRFDSITQRSFREREEEKILILLAQDISNNPSRFSMSSLLEYFGKKDQIAILEKEETEKEMETFSRLVLSHYEKALSRGDPVVSPEHLYFTPEEFSLVSEKFKIFYLQQGPLSPPQCDYAFSLEIESNEDFRMELKATLSKGRSLHEGSPLSVLLAFIQKWKKEGMKIFLVSHQLIQAERMKELLSSYGFESFLEREQDFNKVLNQDGRELTLLIGPLSVGFRNPSEGWMILTEEEIFGEKRRFREGGMERFPTEMKPSPALYKELKENDYVVHTDYGIGIYRGLKRLSIGGISNDYLLLEYLEGDKLYVPVDRLNLIQRYIGAEGCKPRLDRLGGHSWQRAKKKAKKAAEEMVKELLDLYAEREAFHRTSFSPPDASYREFEATFEYEETPDQMKAIREVMEDMSRPKPMDRLICGDVGFGKTEVAIRAAYRAVMDGKQVALLVPTTVLAQQHYHTFSNRFRNYPVIIEMLSRFKKPSEQREILKRVREGKIDILIGTHRILQKDVVFRDLGLLVIDEEHRFGVIQKERLREIKRLVDTIILTATPIPRTLQMGLSGIRDLTLIQTPPEHRLSIQTFIVRYDDEVIREALEREFARQGQAFFVQPRVQNIYSMAHHLKLLVPQAQLAVAHGQMKERELEKVMLQFVQGEYNLLVCTSIIESGLDIPNANTIIINHAEQFGLADLYQLRGRVGRGTHQAYAYLLVPSEISLSRDAARRLRAIQEMSTLGSGFRLALQDLEIRGAGNLLGRSQSGHIAAVGLELYMEMIGKAVRELKGEEIAEEITPEIHLRVPAFIPESYVESPSERLRLYRRLSLCRTDEEVEEMAEELRDRFGKIPEEVLHLLEIIKIKILLMKLAVKKLEETLDQIILTFHESAGVSPQKIVDVVQKGVGKCRFTPDGRLILPKSMETKRDPFGSTRRLLQALA